MKLLIEISMKSLFIMMFIIFSLLSCNEEDTGFTEGNQGVVKTDVTIPHQLFVSQYDMFYRQGSTETHVRYTIALNENDTIKNGYLHLGIYSSIEEAKSALFEYFETNQSFSRPPRLTIEGFTVGDLIFGKVYDGILWMAFTRNNVLVIIYAPTEEAKDIAYEIDKAVLNAPEWKEGMPAPAFVLL